MAFITYNNVGIKAIAACVPSKVVRNEDLIHLIPQEEIEKLVNSIGIKERREASEKVCSSDLCFEAAERLLSDNQVDRGEVDALIF